MWTCYKVPHSVSPWTNIALPGQSISLSVMSVRERERERERGRERVRKREREMYNMVALFLFLTGITGALAPFSYLVII